MIKKSITLVFYFFLATLLSFSANALERRYFNVDELNKLTGGICKTINIESCSGYEVVDSKHNYKTWGVTYKPLKFIKDFCFGIYNGTSIEKINNDVVYAQFHSYTIGRYVGGRCLKTYMLTNKGLNGAMSTNLATVMFDIKDLIERNIKSGISFSKCSDFPITNWPDGRVSFFKLSRTKDRKLLMTLTISRLYSDELYSLNYIRDKKEGFDFVELCDYIDLRRPGKQQ